MVPLSSWLGRGDEVKQPGYSLSCKCKGLPCPVLGILSAQLYSPTLSGHPRDWSLQSFYRKDKVLTLCHVMRTEQKLHLGTTFPRVPAWLQIKAGNKRNLQIWKVGWNSGHQVLEVRCGHRCGSSSHTLSQPCWPTSVLLTSAGSTADPGPTRSPPAFPSPEPGTHSALWQCCCCCC